MNVNTLARGTVFVFVLTVFGLGLNYLYGIVLARWLGAEKFGLFSIGLSIFNILAFSSVMGLDSAALRFIPGAAEARKTTVVRSLVQTVIILGGSAGLFAALTLWLTVDLIATIFPSENDLSAILRFFALAIPAYAGATILISILQAFHDVRWRMFAKYIAEPIAKLVLTISLLALGWGLSGALIGFITALWLSLLLTFLAVRAHLKRFPPRNLEESAAVNPVNIMKYSLPLLIGIIFNVVAIRSDVLILGLNFSASRVGIYAAALQTAAIIVIVLQSVESIFAPVFSEALASGAKKRISEVYVLALRWGLEAGLPLCIIFLLFSQDILGLYGSSFKAATSSFSLLILAQFVNLATGSANYVLLLSGKSRIVMWNEIFISVLLIGLNVWLIPKYEIIGAAIAMVIAVGVTNALRLIQVYVLFQVQPFRWVLWKPLLASVIIYAVGSWLKAMTPHWFGLALVPLLFILYFVLLIVFGLHSQDRQAFKSLFPKRRHY